MAEAQCLQSSAWEFQSYFQNIEQVLNSVDGRQAGILSKKYRFYLSKYAKLHKLMHSLREEYESLDQTVLESLPVQKELKSIEFVEMVSAETMGKLTFFGCKVNSAKQAKRKSQEYILKLKRKINEKKTEFFQLKKEESRIKSELQARAEHEHRREKYDIFKRIQHTHQLKTDWRYLLGKSSQQKLSFNSTSAVKDTPFEKVEAMKRKLLELTPVSEGCQKLKKKAHSSDLLGSSSSLNLEIDSTELLLTECLMEKFNQKRKLKEDFKALPFMELVREISSSRKVKEVLQLLEGEKKEVVRNKL